MQVFDQQIPAPGAGPQDGRDALTGGTGDLAARFAGLVGDEGLVVFSDINAAMLEQGRKRLVDAGISGNTSIAQVDAQDLPFADGSFDIVTMAFGLRNVTDKEAALRSIFGTLKTGGKAMILEFSEPHKTIKPMYDLYSFKVLPALGKLVARDSDSYQYLAESIRVHPDQEAQALVDRVGQRLVQSSKAGQTDWQFDFHLLADPRTVNAFALPGGQIFVTAALFNRFETEGQLAGVLGHEIGHVVARHSAQRIAKQQLTQGLTGAVLVASGGGGSEAQLAAMVGQMINMKYGREDELQSDNLGVLFMSEAGYDPRALIVVMGILDEAAGGQTPPEWMSTHPSHGNRVATIQAAIDKVYPDGVPKGLIP